MAILVPDVGERYLLDRALKGTNNGNNLTIKLYTAVTGGLVEGTVAGDFSEATFPGYTGVTLTPATWGAASTTTGTSSSTYGSAAVFTRSSTGSVENIIGYYVVDATTGTLVYAEAFGASIPVTNSGDNISITPKIEMA